MDEYSKAEPERWRTQVKQKDRKAKAELGDQKTEADLVEQSMKAEPERKTTQVKLKD